MFDVRRRRALPGRRRTATRLQRSVAASIEGQFRSYQDPFPEIGRSLTAGTHHLSSYPRFLWR